VSACRQRQPRWGWRCSSNVTGTPKSGQPKWRTSSTRARTLSRWLAQWRCPSAGGVTGHLPRSHRPTAKGKPVPVADANHGPLVKDGRGTSNFTSTQPGQMITLTSFCGMARSGHSSLPLRDAYACIPEFHGPLTGSPPTISLWIDPGGNHHGHHIQAAKTIRHHSLTGGITQRVLSKPMEPETGIYRG
jgi:hypothetical protein